MFDSSDHTRTLVLAVGNDATGDDGFGPAVGRALSADRLPDGVEVALGGVLGIDLLSEIEDLSRLILVDAIRPRRAGDEAGERGSELETGRSRHWGERPDPVPGEVVVFRLSEVELEDPDPRFSLHDLSLGGCLRLARLLSLRLPEIQVVGFVLPDGAGGSAESSLDAPSLSAAAERAVPVAVARIHALLGLS